MICVRSSCHGIVRVHCAVWLPFINHYFLLYFQFVFNFFTACSHATRGHLFVCHSDAVTLFICMLCSHCTFRRWTKISEFLVFVHCSALNILPSQLDEFSVVEKTLISFSCDIVQLTKTFFSLSGRKLYAEYKNAADWTLRVGCWRHVGHMQEDEVKKRAQADSIWLYNCDFNEITWFHCSRGIFFCFYFIKHHLIDSPNT